MVMVMWYVLYGWSRGAWHEVEAGHGLLQGAAAAQGLGVAAGTLGSRGSADMVQVAASLQLSLGTILIDNKQ